MTATELYKEFRDDLENIYSSSEASAITANIFESIAGLSRADMMKHSDKEVDQGIHKKILESLSKLKQYMPLQYITGEAWFYGMKLKVSPSVLIPRPETEELVEASLKKIKKEKVKHILEIGTGSGCIAIALKLHLPEVQITAVDICSDALAVAKENAHTHHAEINFLQSDFLEEKRWEKYPVYDVIISNPPYIPETESALMNKNVTEHEPHKALFVPPHQPLIFYEKIADFGLSHLSDSGNIFLETHENFATETAELFSARSYAFETCKDLSGKERMLFVSRRYR